MATDKQKANAAKLKALNLKYSANFMVQYCKDNGQAEWWNNTIKTVKVGKDGKERKITLAEVRSAFIRQFFPSELKGKKAADWRVIL
jgi:hypothetical protein